MTSLLELKVTAVLTMRQRPYAATDTAINVDPIACISSVLASTSGYPPLRQ